jgi:Dolichyl-phosphate-mannose-protein mannosyltransferase
VIRLPKGGTWEISAAGGAVAVGAFLRLGSYASVPYRAPNPDEWNWAWAGLSQLQGMPPTAWTIFWKAYPPSVLVAPPAPYTLPLVHPWVDAPPLFSWLIGAYAWLDGDRTLNDVINDPAPRLLGILLSLAAMALAYALGRLVLGVFPSLVGLWLLATAPIPVVLDRLVAAEQLIAVPLLAACLAIYRLRRTPDDGRWQWLLLGCCLVAPWVKAPGLVVGISAVLLLLARRQFRLAAIAGGITIASQAAVLVYTASLDWHSYVAEVSIRASQLSALTGYRFITNSTGFDGQQALDGWWLLGWLGLAEFLGRRRGDSDLVAVPAVVYLILMLGTAAYYSAGYGWYRLAVMPLVYLAAGRFLWLAVWELSWLRLGIAAALGIATAANWAVPLHIKFDAVNMGLIVLVAILPALLALAMPRLRAYARGAGVALLAAIVPISLLEVANLAYIYGS